MDAATESQWFDFWQRLGAKGNPAQSWQRLAVPYSEEWRRYHNLSHIGHCLNEFNAVVRFNHNPLAVEAAIWLHDVVYDTHRKDNEERSADFATAVLCEAGMDSEFVETTHRLILATKHATLPDTEDAALLTDIDLSILGQPQEVYARFEQDIRSEYSWVSETDFAAGRTLILRSFLSRSNIFSTIQLRLKYETPARSNLEWAIAQLVG